MNISLNIVLGAEQLNLFEAAMLLRAQSLVAPAQAAMTGRYAEIVRSNFGAAGIDRPHPWPLLSQRYAKRVGRTYATLFVSGALYNSVKEDPQAGKVSVSADDCAYALVHQHGGGNNVPARPYFPMREDGAPTPFTERAVAASAKDAIARELA